MSNRPQVICIPGGVAPAAQRYAALTAAVAGTAETHPKDLEVYREDRPPAGYAIEMELAAIDRFADSLHLDRLHLVGYSGGGFISLAYAGTRPGRLLSLAVFEPAAIPGTPTPVELDYSNALEAKLSGLDGPAFMEAFVREQVKPGAHLPPPPASPSPEMRKRPGGIEAMMRAFGEYRFDRGLYAASRFPVFAGYGDMTHDIESVRAGIIARLFADVHVMRFAGVHHFDPPEKIYNTAHVDALSQLWRSAARG
jgi:pimeloyl-ACP methyl ester carboxylesterase